MDEVTLQALLEAGCHFGHKAERWHPKARDFIYTEKDGIHIIDLAKTKAGLEKAAEFVRETVAQGGEVLFVATKRQASGVVREAVEAVGAPYFVERWIGGFLTNWEGVKKNLEKINALSVEEKTGVWKKFPKHEQGKLAHYLAKLKGFYGGVLTLKVLPQALFIVDVKKEVSALREAKRMNIPVLAIVDTNSDPTPVDYVIPANDDAVGSIQYLTKIIAEAYREGKDLRAKETGEPSKPVAVKAEVTKIKEVKKEAKVEAPVKKKTGRPKKTAVKS